MQTENYGKLPLFGSRQANAGEGTRIDGQFRPRRLGSNSECGLDNVISEFPLFGGNRQTELFGEEWRAKLKALKIARQMPETI